MIRKKIIILSIMFLNLIGCSCQNNDIPELVVTKSRDKYLNCNNLKKEMLTAQFEIKANNSRSDALPTYAKNPTCLLQTKLKIDRALNKAENRLLYLQMLATEKDCEQLK